MSVFATIIFSVILAGFVVQTVVDVLNLRAISPNLPDEFTGWYSPEKYAKAQNYLRETTGFSLFCSTVDLFILFLFIFSGLFNNLDLIARAAGFGAVGSGVLFSILMMLVFKLVGIPRSYYAVFVLEHKYGFNRTTLKTFVADIFKGFALSAVLGGIALAGLIWFFGKFGQYAWLYAWAGVTLFQLAVAYIAPVLIMPLFNKYVPLSAGELKNEIEDYAVRQEFKMKGVFTMDGSRRSTKSNAFFTGFGRFRRIVLFDTLIAAMSVREIVSVLAHEVGHYKKRHIFKGMAVSIAETGLMLFIFSLFVNNAALARVFGFEHNSVYASMMAFGFLYAPVSFALGVWGAYLSRRNEYEADLYAVTTYPHGRDFIAALKKLSVENLSNLTPHWLKVKLEYSHPPVLERIAAIRRVAGITEPVVPPPAQESGAAAAESAS